MDDMESTESWLQVSVFRETSLTGALALCAKYSSISSPLSPALLHTLFHLEPILYVLLLWPEELSHSANLYRLPYRPVAVAPAIGPNLFFFTVACGW